MSRTYIKHSSGDSTYGELIDGEFFQHTWINFNKKNNSKNDARGELGEFVHKRKVLSADQLKQFVIIDKNEYEIIFFRDYNKIK